MTKVKSCLLCENYKTHPCECVHCEDWDNFRTSEDGKNLVKRIENEVRPKGDLISRQDAIDALEEQLDYLQMLNKNENPTAEGKWYGVNWARNTIADLPYKQNERPQGHWIVESELKCLYYCSNCRSNGNRNQPFCGWCGADMRGEVK